MSTKQIKCYFHPKDYILLCVITVISIVDVIIVGFSLRDKINILCIYQ